MNEKRSSGRDSAIRRRLVAQFERPHGWLGRLAAWTMAHRESNQRRNLWTIDLLDVAPNHRVLDVGCGPGFAVAALAERLSNGQVVGLDHSRVALDQARRRNRRSVTTGRVVLILGSYTALPELGAPFDRMMAVNSLMFSGETEEVLSALRRRLKPDGMLAVTSQSRAAHADDEGSDRMADRIAAGLMASGFDVVARDVLSMQPASAVCIRARPARGAR